MSSSEEQVRKMIFSVNTKELSEAVSNLGRAVAGKTTIPTLEGILIVTDDNSINMTAYNTELGMKTKLQATVKESGAIVLSARLFTEIVRKAPNDTVTVSVDGKKIATIESGDSSFTLIGMDPDEFPELPDVEENSSFGIDGETLKSMIRQTIFAVAESDAKPVHQGTLFSLKDGVLELVSVDGFRLALRREKVNVPSEASFVVPGKTLGEVVKLIKDGTVEICPGKRNIMFKIDNYTVVSTILEGDFLDYHSAVPKNFSTTVAIKTRDFIESTERVSLIISDRLKSPIRCIFGETGVKLSCTTSVGKAHDRINAHIEGNALEMGFNNKYLLDALKNCECDEIKLSLGGPLNPMVITPKDSDSFLFLVLPVRLKTE